MDRIVFEQIVWHSAYASAHQKLITDMDGKAIDYEFVYVNKAFESFTGLSSKEIIGKRARSLFPDSESVTPERLEFLHGITLDGNSGDYEEYCPTLGKWFKIQVFSFKKNHFSTVALDISEHKEQAEENDRLKMEFLANMSHEIRTPMNAIIGFTSFLKDPAKSREEIGRFADIITSSGNHLMMLINDIIDISKINAGKVTVSRAPVDINYIFREQYAFFNSEIQNKKGGDVTLLLKIPEKELCIDTDKTRTLQNN